MCQARSAEDFGVAEGEATGVAHGQAEKQRGFPRRQATFRRGRESTADPRHTSPEPTGLDPFERQRMQKGSAPRSTPSERELIVAQGREPAPAAHDRTDGGWR